MGAYVQPTVVKKSVDSDGGGEQSGCNASRHNDALHAGILRLMSMPSNMSRAIHWLHSSDAAVETAISMCIFRGASKADYA